MISNADIDRYALEVIHKLKQGGYDAYLVGGCVRDLLIKRTPKDFDIATNALPNEIKQLFRNCRLIGRRFRLAHIYFGRRIIEVATFRGPHNATSDDGVTHASGFIMRDNVYGTLEEDAWRRDFTINAFYYDPDTNQIVDHIGGMEDLKNKTIRMIGDPEQRYREDPVRMLRAIRFAANLSFNIEPKTSEPIFKLAELLLQISPARLFEETVKLFHGGKALNTYELLQQYQLFATLFPLTQTALTTPLAEKVKRLIKLTLTNTDSRIAQNKTVTPAFLFAVLLWYPVQIAVKNAESHSYSTYDALQFAIYETLKAQQKSTAIPRYLTNAMREIWQLQYQLERRQGKKPMQLVTQPRFRAAYDLLMLRVEAGELDKELGEWWTHFQECEPQEQLTMLAKLSKNKDQNKKSKKKRTKTQPE